MLDGEIADATRLITSRHRSRSHSGRSPDVSAFRVVLVLVHEQAVFALHLLNGGGSGLGATKHALLPHAAAVHINTGGGQER